MWSRSRNALAVGAALAIVSGVAAGCTPPPPTASPSISWHFTTPQATAGQGIRITYSSANVPLGGHLIMQRTNGPTSTWLAVAAVRILPNGTAVLPPAPMGHYAYRLVVTDLHLRTLTTSTRYINSFAVLPLATILGTTASTNNFGGTLFTSVSAGNFQFNPTSCRSIDLSAIYAGGSGKTGTVSVLQEAAAAVSVNIPYDTIRNLHANLTGGPFEVTSPFGMFVNGTASCWSASGTH